MGNRRGCLLFGTPQIQGKEELPYRMRDDFLSDAEFSFFGVLKQIFGERYVIFSKVTLKEIFFVSRPNENMSYYNKIDRKHVDFVLYDLESRKPVLGIELDDKSHGRSDRKERDVFVNDVFEAAGLPLARVMVAASYNVVDLKRYLEEKLFGQDNVSKQETAEDKTGVEATATKETAATTTGLTVCPKCGIAMVIRNSKRGRFYGCKNYPRCKEIKNI